MKKIIIILAILSIVVTGCHKEDELTYTETTIEFKGVNYNAIALGDVTWTTENVDYKYQDITVDDMKESGLDIPNERDFGDLHEYCRNPEISIKMDISNNRWIYCNGTKECNMPNWSVQTITEGTSKHHTPVLRLIKRN